MKKMYSLKRRQTGRNPIPVDRASGSSCKKEHHYGVSADMARGVF